MSDLETAIRDSAAAISELAAVLYGKPEETCVCASTFMCVATLLAHHGIEWSELPHGETEELMSDVCELIELAASAFKASRN